MTLSFARCKTILLFTKSKTWLDREAYYGRKIIIQISYRISYADAFAIVSAKQLNACLITGNPEIAALNGIIQVEELKR